MMDLQKREKYVKTALTVYELQKLVSVRMKECFALLCCKYPNKPNSLCLQQGKQGEYI